MERFSTLKVGPPIGAKTYDGKTDLTWSIWGQKEGSSQIRMTVAVMDTQSHVPLDH